MFSAIDNNIKRLETDIELEKSMKPAEPWKPSEQTEAKRKARVAKSLKDFWYFDKTYFSQDMYSGGYSEPNRMCLDIAKAFDSPGVHVFVGPRGHAKSVTAKKKMVHQMLTYSADVAGVSSEDLSNSSNLLRDIATLIVENDKIIYDFGIEAKVLNDDKFQFRTRSDGTIKKWRYLQAFSEGRSVRGFTRVFSRPKIVLIDDMETLDSSMTSDAVQKRLKRLAETYDSLSGEDATMLVLANDFDVRSAIHLLKLDYETGTLPKKWKVSIYKAWDGSPLWKARFPAKTEELFKQMLGVKSESDYQGNYQQNPIPPEGIIFRKEHYEEYSELPKDARGVMYLDPNLSKKGKGDTTAAVVLLYSPETGQYYVSDALCRSYSDSDKLLNDALEMSFSNSNVFAFGFDGNVSQESIWTNNIKQWCQRHKSPFRRVEYKRYNVDLFAKNCQMAWNEKVIKFKPGFSRTKQGETFLNQLFSFAGKKANKHDDAPDALICAFEFIHERGFVKRKGSVIRQNFTIESNYTF